MSIKSGSIAGDSLEAGNIGLRESINTNSVPALKVSLNDSKKTDSIITRSNDEQIDLANNSPYVTERIL